MKQIKLTGNRRPTVRHSGGGAQSGNLAQGTRNHRSASDEGACFGEVSHTTAFAEMRASRGLTATAEFLVKFSATRYEVNRIISYAQL